MPGLVERCVNGLLSFDDQSVTMRNRTPLRMVVGIATFVAVTVGLGGAAVYAQSVTSAAAKPAWSGLTLPPEALAERTEEVVVFANAHSGANFSGSPQTPPKGGVVLSVSGQNRIDAPQFGEFAPQDQIAGASGQVNVTAEGIAGGPFDVGFSQRAQLAEGGQGRLVGRGAEVRFGQGLGNMLGRSTINPQRPSWYFFAAGDGQALTWAPGTVEGLAYQDNRVTVGDLQAGFTYEHRGVQTSFSYLQREVSNSRRGAGAQSRSETESFVGATVTVKR
jgi:hypothetical protein